MNMTIFSSSLVATKMDTGKKTCGAGRLWKRAMKLGLLLVVSLLEMEAPAQVYRIAATVTITNAPTTNSQTLTVNSDTRTWTNTPSLNPAIYIQTNATVNGSATNLFQHLATYRFSASINTTYANTNALKIQAGVGASLSVTIGGSWASVVYSTQLVSTPFTVPVIVPFATLTPTNATNIANMLLNDLQTFGNAPPLTNASNLASSNATVKPIWFDRVTSTLRFLSAEAGTNMTLTITPTSVVFSASAAPGITNLNGLTNYSQWFTGTSTGSDFSITTRTGATGGTNVFDLPTAANAVSGKLSSNSFQTFTLKQPPSTTLTNLSATGAGTNAHPLFYAGPTNNGIGSGLILKAGTGLTASTNNGTNFLLTAIGGIAQATNDLTAGWDGTYNFGTTNLSVVRATLFGSGEVIFSGLDLGRSLNMLLDASGGDFDLVFPCEWHWRTAIPATLIDGTFAYFEARVFGTNNSDVVAAFTVATNNPCSLTASNASFTTALNTTYNGGLDNWIDNPCMASITSYSLTASPSHGIVVLNTSTGAFSYTPTTGYSGTDSFGYRAVGPCSTRSATLTVTITP